LALQKKGTVIETRDGWNYLYFAPSSSDGIIQKYSMKGHEPGSYMFNHSKTLVLRSSIDDLAENEHWAISRRGGWTIIKSKGSDFCLYLNGGGFAFVMSNGAGMAVNDGICRPLSAEAAAAVVDQGKAPEAVAGNVVTGEGLEAGTSGQAAVIVREAKAVESAAALPATPALQGDEGIGQEAMEVGGRE
jgi:hypothetical protein